MSASAVGMQRANMVVSQGDALGLVIDDSEKSRSASFIPLCASLFDPIFFQPLTAFPNGDSLR